MPSEYFWSILKWFSYIFLNTTEYKRWPYFYSIIRNEEGIVKHQGGVGEEGWGKEMFLENDNFKDLGAVYTAIVHQRHSKNLLNISV